MLLCIIMFQKKDIFYKYLKISKLFNCQKLAIYKKFDCYIKTKKKF